MMASPLADGALAPPSTVAPCALDDIVVAASVPVRMATCAIGDLFSEAAAFVEQPLVPSESVLTEAKAYSDLAQAYVRGLFPETLAALDDVNAPYAGTLSHAMLLEACEAMLRRPPGAAPFDGTMTAVGK